LKVPPQAIAAAITVMAVLAFVGAEKLGERATPRGRRYAFATVGALAVIALVTIAIPATPATAGEPARTIRAADLAKTIVDAPWSVRVVDVRDAASFAKSRVPGSENVAATALNDLPRDERALVVVGDAKRRLERRSARQGDDHRRSPAAAASCEWRRHRQTEKERRRLQCLTKSGVGRSSSTCSSAASRPA
jgi:hypothetical protein